MGKRFLLFTLVSLVGLLDFSWGQSSLQEKRAVALRALQERRPQFNPTFFQKKAAAQEALLRDLLEKIVTEKDRHLFEIVDRQRRLSATYKPGDLEPVPSSQGKQYLRKEALEALRDLRRAAGSDIKLSPASCFRSYAYQVQIFDHSVKSEGLAATEKVIARPGHSQHQLGLALDFYPINTSFAATRAYTWLLQNAWRFGYSLSYPRGREAETGYSYEPWHWRYIGRPAAALAYYFFDSNQQYTLDFIELYKKEVGILN